MAETTLQLSLGDLLCATGLVVVAALVSFVLRLDLEKRLAWASLRTATQLLMVGYVLKAVFELDRAWAVVLLMSFMVFMASRAAVGRASRTYRGATKDAFITLSLCAVITTLTVTRLVIGVEPWFKPQYVIPLLGMVLGNGLTGVSLSLNVVLDRLHGDRAIIEMELAHGASRWEAARDVLRDSVRLGMIPIINSMCVVGLVSLPGMMTGQILAGNPPLTAVRYQIVVMFMIAAATSLGCMGTVLFVYHHFFNHRHQLRWEDIKKH
jgi:putative ABC transport system permease protein